MSYNLSFVNSFLLFPICLCYPNYLKFFRWRYYLCYLQVVLLTAIELFYNLLLLPFLFPVLSDQRLLMLSLTAWNSNYICISHLVICNNFIPTNNFWFCFPSTHCGALMKTDIKYSICFGILPTSSLVPLYHSCLVI